MIDDLFFPFTFPHCFHLINIKDGFWLERKNKKAVLEKLPYRPMAPVQTNQKHFWRIADPPSHLTSNNYFVLKSAADRPPRRGRNSIFEQSKNVKTK